MRTLQTLLCWLFGLSLWVVAFGVRLPLIVVEYAIIAPLKYLLVKFKPDIQVLPKWLSLFDSKTSGFRNNGYHNPELWYGGGDWQERQDMLAKGYSEPMIALKWGQRNPVSGFQHTIFGSRLREMTKVITGWTSFSRYKNSHTLKEHYSPFPWRMRQFHESVLNNHKFSNRLSYLWFKYVSGRFYFDFELVKIGWFYYPLIRYVVIWNDTYHSEGYLGYKNYRYKVLFVEQKMFDNPDIVNDDLHQAPTLSPFNFRKDEDWA